MLNAWRIVRSYLPHVPWLLAVGVLLFGLFAYSPRQPEPPKKTPEPQEPVSFINEESFNQLMQQNQQGDPAFPFAMTPAEDGGQK